MKIAVILPSRGLMFSQTAEEILSNLKEIEYKFIFAHRQSIPDCFEVPTVKALADKSITHLWFVEDDMILPPDTLSKLIAMDKAVVTADYPVNKNGRGSIFRDKGGKILFSGTGCLLVKREVFNELKAPYFRTDIRWNIKNFGDFIKLTGAKTGQNDGYGLHDVNFSMNLHRLKIPIHAIDTVLGQRKLIKLGKAGSNDGAHQIDKWTKVKKDHLLKEVRKWPVQTSGNLVTVLTPTGEISVSREHQKKLIKAGLGTKPPHTHSVIDDSAVL